MRTATLEQLLLLLIHICVVVVIENIQLYRLVERYQTNDITCKRMPTVLNTPTFSGSVYMKQNKRAFMRQKFACIKSTKSL